MFEIYIILWLYVFGFLGTLMTQAAENNWDFKPLLNDYPSLLGMLAWPVTVPLALVLIGYDSFRMWLDDRSRL